MTLRDLLASLRKHLMIVLVTTVVATGGAYVASSLADPVYRSTTGLYFTLDAGGDASDLNQGSTYTQAQMLSFARLVTMPVVLEPVIERLGLDTTASSLAGRVSARQAQSTTILEIQATAGGPEAAAALAREVTEELMVVVRAVAPTDEDGESAVKMLVVNEASVPEFPIAPSTRRNVLAGFVVGLLLGGLLAYLRDALDTRVRSPEDVQEAVDLPVLGSISRSSRRRRSSPQIAPRLEGPRAEEFRRMRANLRFLGVDQDGLCLVVTSAVAGEGKTTTCLELAVTLAEADLSVLVVDADLRRPRVATYLGLEPSSGLSGVLIGGAGIEDVVVQPWGVHGIDVVAAGQVPPNPSELLATRTLGDLLVRARSRYDVVLVDAPPLLPVADAAVLSVLASGVVLVVDTTRSRRAHVREAVQAVEQAGGRILGAVLNRVPPHRSTEYRYAQDTAPPTRRARHGRRRSARDVRPGSAPTIAWPRIDSGPAWVPYAAQEHDSGEDAPAQGSGGAADGSADAGADGPSGGQVEAAVEGRDEERADVHPHGGSS